MITMRADDILGQVVDELATATDEASLVAIGRRAVRRLGFQSFAYLSFAHPRSAFLSSYPEVWKGHYVRNGYERIDPVVVQARKSRTGFYWDGSRPSTPTSLAQRRLFREASAFGINNGVTVPIHGGFGQLAAFTLAGEDRDPAFPRYASEALDMLHLLGLYYHAHARAKLQLGLLNVDQSPLTQRELQCLVWMAKGKTMTEAAVLLRISTRTVRFHMDNARAKLSASTIPHAVAEATRRGLIAV